MVMCLGARIGAAFGGCQGVNDLNSERDLGQASGICPGASDVCWQTRLCSDDGIRAVAHLPATDQETPWRLQRSQLQLFGPVSVHGFCELTYRESLRDIEACLRAQASKLYHLGIR